MHRTKLRGIATVLLLNRLNAMSLLLVLGCAGEDMYALLASMIVHTLVLLGTGHRCFAPNCVVPLSALGAWLFANRCLLQALPLKLRTRTVCSAAIGRPLTWLLFPNSGRTVAVLFASWRMHDRMVRCRTWYCIWMRRRNYFVLWP